MTSRFSYRIHDIVELAVEVGRFQNYPTQRLAAFEVNGVLNPVVKVQIAGATPDLETQPCGGEYCQGHHLLHWRGSRKLAVWEVGMTSPDADPSLVHFRGNPFAGKHLLFQVLEPLLNYKLCARGYVLLHASAVSRAGNAQVFSGYPGSGKTSIALHLLDRDASGFLADELTILSRDGSVYSYPTKIDLFSYTVANCPFLRKRLGMLSKANLLAKTMIGKLSGGFIKSPLSVDANVLFRDAKVIDKGALSSVHLVSTSPTGFFQMRSVDPAHVVEQLISISKFQFRYFENWITADAPYLAKSNWRTYKRVLVEALQEVPCYEIQLPSSLSLQADRIMDSIETVLD